MGDAILSVLLELLLTSHEGYRDFTLAPRRTMWYIFSPTPSGWWAKRKKRTAKLWQRFLNVPNNIKEESLLDVWNSRTIDQSAGGNLRERNTKESWELLEDLALHDNESWNDPRDFAKPVKTITLPQDVPSTSGRRLIDLKNQVQRLIEAHLAR
ncbi:hypothetical protein Tco_0909202 [Tanacetum coccineum]|uniref:MAK10-like protein n=1 Tax=Tanacetum coccineum TaxID=301880 RepID=A0ABQ5CRD1_9ASTR